MNDIDISKQTGIVKDILVDKEKRKQQELEVLTDEAPENWKSAEIGKLAQSLAKAQSEM